MEQKYFLLHLLFSPLHGLREKSLYVGTRTFLSDTEDSDQVIAASYNITYILGKSWERAPFIQHIFIALLLNMLVIRGEKEKNRKIPSPHIL